LVISRSGSSSIFEIIGFKKPAILIPYAKSINGDQLENAKFLSNKKAAILFEDNIFNTIKNIMNNKEILSNISNNLKMLYTPNITKKFEKLIEDLV
ncbi:MAG: hypothetical protein LBF70_01935, partial [Holosporales bacterium]|jgi:UDP-N-acetylglucosamine:LPS N-acetylglucosamine transferase|nr:hypothetical protein [Holosporales bacterium]